MKSSVIVDCPDHVSFIFWTRTCQWHSVNCSPGTLLFRFVSYDSLMPETSNRWLMKYRTNTWAKPPTIPLASNGTTCKLTSVYGTIIGTVL